MPRPPAVRARLPLVAVLLSGALCAAVLLAAPRAAAQGLFDDNEARRRIAALRAEVEERGKAVDERLARIEASVQDARKPLLDLVQMIDALRGDIARLRGQTEVLANQQENLEKRQRDLYVDLDARLRRMEEQQQAIQQQQQAVLQQQQAIAERLAQPERDAQAEKTAYESALNQFKVGNYQSAIAGFQTFMVNFPNSQLVPSAQYWVGNAYYALRDYKVAISAQQKVLASWPDNAKAPDSMLNIASSQAELGDQKAARDTLRNLITRYPNSPAAEQARQRLGGRR